MRSRVRLRHWITATKHNIFRFRLYMTIISNILLFMNIATPLNTLHLKYRYSLRSYWVSFSFTGSRSPLGPGLWFSSCMIILQTVGLLRRVTSSSQGLYINTGQHKHRKNTYTYQTSMSWVGFAPTIPASERANTVHALDYSATSHRGSPDSSLGLSGLYGG
jgi:hypothetical protein